MLYRAGIKKTVLLVVLVLAVCFISTSTILAMSSASYQLSWHSMSAGGRGGESATYALMDTLGQSPPNAVSESTKYRLGGVYWYGAPPLAPAVNGCFIASAAYGSYLDSRLDTLRAFRDQYLMTNTIGQDLVYLYYKHSPPVAKFINEHPALKPVVRVALLPAVAMSTVAVKTTLVEKIAIVGLLVFASFILVIWARKWRGKGLQHYQG